MLHAGFPFEPLARQCPDLQGPGGFSTSRFFEVDTDIPSSELSRAVEYIVMAEVVRSGADVQGLSLALALAVAWVNKSVADGNTTAAPIATFEFNGTDSTGVRVVCSLTAR